MEAGYVLPSLDFHLFAFSPLIFSNKNLIFLHNLEFPRQANAFLGAPYFTVYGWEKKILHNV